MLITIFLPIVVGLAIFLAGMKIMELALHYWAGPYLKQALEKFTKTPIRGLLTGTGLSALLQSSSAITVITIGLVNAGLMRFPHTLGIILGTNIGTCITTELIGLNITSTAVPLLLTAAPVWLVSWAFPQNKRKLSAFIPWVLRFRYLSLAVSGFACVLLGIEVMQAIVPELQSRGLFAWFVEQSQRSLLWGIIAGAALTGVIQSGTATIAMAMGLASVQAISVELGIAIALGANVGTCVTAFLASIGGSKYGRYVAWAHILLNIGGVLMFYPIIWLLHDTVVHFSSSASGQIARAQTVFNIVVSFVALPLCYLPIFRKV